MEVERSIQNIHLTHKQLLLVKGYTDFGGRLGEEWVRSALITDFVNIIHLLEAPSERPNLFHQLRNAVQNTMNKWDTTHPI